MRLTVWFRVGRLGLYGARGACEVQGARCEDAAEVGLGR